MVAEILEFDELLEIIGRDGCRLDVGDLRDLRTVGDEEFMTVPDAAKLLGVSEETVRKLFDAGQITGMRTRPGPGGHRRPSRASVEAYRRRQRGEHPDT